LHVINTGDTAQHIQIIIEAVDIIVDPQSFDLDAGENKLVNVSLNTMDTGEYTGSILITARSLQSNENGLGFGAAVRVPVSFTIEDEMSEGLILVIMLLILLVIAAFMWKRH